MTEVLSTISHFENIAEDLAANTRLRNALAHEYLDLRYKQVRGVAAEARELYGSLVSAVEDWMEGQPV